MKPPWYVEPEQTAAWLKWHKAVHKGGNAAEAMALTKSLCKANPAFVLQNYMAIVDKDFNERPFRPWHPAQIRLYKTVRNLVRRGLPVRIIIVKPRQTGISTVAEGLAYQHCAFQDNHRALVMAHEEDPGLLNIYRMFRQFHGSVPDSLRPETKSSSTEKMEFTNKSIITHKTAATGSTRKSEMGKGRGSTYSFLHASEFAYWPVPDAFIQAVEDGVPDRPGTFEFIESTAKGYGDFFHRRWRKAARGWRMAKGEDGVARWTKVDRNDSIWVPFFISWLEQGEYTMPLADDSEAERRAFVRSYDKAEKRLVEQYGATPEQIRWRRYQIDEKKDGDVEAFQKEYPAAPDEAFIFSGRRVFDMGAMRNYMDAARAKELQTPGKRGHLVMRH